MDVYMPLDSRICTQLMRATRHSTRQGLNFLAHIESSASDAYFCRVKKILKSLDHRKRFKITLFIYFFKIQEKRRK